MFKLKNIFEEIVGTQPKIVMHQEEEIRSMVVDVDSGRNLAYHGVGNIRYVKVDHIWKYKEFDRRDPNQDRGFSSSNDNVDKLKQLFIEEGYKSGRPLVMAYYYNAGVGTPEALLEEGNHRLVAAMELGMEFLPVVCVIKFKDTPKSGAKDVESPFRIQRQLCSGYFPSEIDASFVFSSEALVTGPLQGLI